MLALVLACLPAALALDFSQWKSPGPGDVRSPCPGLNTLANHGFLPHDGRNMTFEVLIPAMQQALSVGPDFTLAIGTAAMGANPHQNPAAPYFDLDMLDEHNFPIEHDFSLSRGDAYFGDDHSFNQTIWDSVVEFGNFKQKGYFDLATAAKARFMRLQTSRRTNPGFTYLPQGFIFSYGETALYLSTMGDNSNSAPYEYVRSLFEDEKLPYEQGWRPASTEITLLTLGAMVFEENLAVAEPLLEGLLLTQGTINAVFQGLDPLTGQPTKPPAAADAGASASANRKLARRSWS